MQRYSLPRQGRHKTQRSAEINAPCSHGRVCWSYQRAAWRQTPRRCDPQKRHTRDTRCVNTKCIENQDQFTRPPASSSCAINSSHIFIKSAFSFVLRSTSLSKLPTFISVRPNFALSVTSCVSKACRFLVSSSLALPSCFSLACPCPLSLEQKGTLPVSSRRALSTRRTAH